MSPRTAIWLLLVTITFGLGGCQNTGRFLQGIGLPMSMAPMVR
jgi:hypothetical protein